MLKALFKKIIVAVNGSESSTHALKYALILAKDLHLSVKVVYVVDTSSIKKLTLSKLFDADENDYYESALSSDGKRFLEYVLELAKKKGVRVETELRKGSVWLEIVKAAYEYHADHIIIGGHEIKPSDTLHKSVASTTLSEIIASSRCSVVVVKQSDIDQLFKLFS